MTIKTKAILITAGTILAIFLFFSFHQVSDYNKQIDYRLTEERKKFQDIVNLSQELYFQLYNDWLTHYVESGESKIRAFAQRDRKKLYELSLPMFTALKKAHPYGFTALKKAHPYVYVMHFHLPDGHSFLRMHKPKFYGDDLRMIRPSIQYVHQNKKRLTCYEIGVYGAFYRIVHPIFYQGKYIGAVELGIEANEIVSRLKKTTGIDTTTFFFNKYWKKAVKNSETQKTFGEYTVVESKPVITAILPTNFSFKNINKTFETKDRNYLIHTPTILKNGLNEPIGGIIALQDITSSSRNLRNLIIQSLLVTLFIGAICIIFISINFQKLIRNLEQSKEAKNLLIKELQDEVDIRLGTEKALMESEKKYRKILNSLPDAILLLDTSFKVIWGNNAAFDFMPQLLGLQCELILSSTGADCEECLCKKAQATLTIQKETIRFDNLPGKEPESYWDVTVIPQIDKQGTCIGSLVSMRNVTKRETATQKVEQLNRRNRLLLEAVGEGIYGVDLEGNTTFMNPAAERMTGFLEKEIIGKHQHELLHHSKADGSPYHSLDCPVYATMKTNKLCYVSDEVFWKKDGSSFPVEYVATPIVENDIVIGAVVLFSDITERKEMETQLLHAQKMEAVGQLTGGISHDFNNLLTPIIGYCELLLLELGDKSELYEQLEMILEAAETASELTRQLLAFSRKQRLEKKWININDVIQKLGKMLHRLIGENIALDLKNECHDCSILADPGQIEQIIMNLIVNAKDAMPEGGNLSINVKSVTFTDKKSIGFDSVQPGSYLLLIISDTGEGMTLETQKRIFEPFFTTKEQGKGTGLGLATVYGIVKQHNGYITLKSALGKGTSFEIYFPLTNTNDATNEESPQDEVTMPSGTETILVVDDAPYILRLIKDTLYPLGYNILTAESGEIALETYEKQAPDIQLLLTDIVLPGMNGIELAKRFQHNYPNMKVLYISGYADTNFDQQTNLASDKINFLDKPLKPSKIASTVRAILNATS